MTPIADDDVLTVCAWCRNVKGKRYATWTRFQGMSYDIPCCPDDGRSLTAGGMCRTCRRYFRLTRDEGQPVSHGICAKCVKEMK